jgi:hypothetical protein
MHAGGPGRKRTPIQQLLIACLQGIRSMYDFHTLRLFSRAAAISMLTALVACGRSSNVSATSAGQNAAQPQSGQIVVAAGTTFYGKLQESIDSKTSHDGDKFELRQTDTLMHKSPQLHGTTIEGHLTNVQPAGPLRKPGMTIVFDDMVLADGNKEPVNVQLMSLHAFDAKTHHLRTIGLMISGAIAAHMMHARTGHGSGLMGAAGGYILSQTLKTDISVPAGTVLELRFRSPVTEASPPAQ